MHDLIYIDKSSQKIRFHLKQQLQTFCVILFHFLTRCNSLKLIHFLKFPYRNICRSAFNGCNTSMQGKEIILQLKIRPQIVGPSSDWIRKTAWLCLLTLMSVWCGESNDIHAQGCDKIVFKVTNTNKCCYQLSAENMTDNCFQQLNIKVPDGIFSSFVQQPGWQINQAGPNEYNVRPSVGFIPFGKVDIANFCVSGISNQDVIILWDNLCALEGCEAILPIKACEPAGFISGVKYVDIGCEGKLYTNQPVLADWPIDLYNELGILIANTQTDDKGRFSFSGLPAGTYTCREGIQSGWQSSLPKSGEYKLRLKGDADSSVVNFGNCPTTCNCDSAFLDMVQVEDISPDTGYYYLSVSSGEAYCFKNIVIYVDSGSIASWDIVIPGWKVNAINKDQFEVIPPSPSIPEGSFIPVQFKLVGGKTHAFTITTMWNGGTGLNECKRRISYPFPITPIERSCCPSNSQPGPELASNGNFTFGWASFSWDNAAYIGNTIVNGPGKLAVTNGNLITSHNGNFSCIAKNGNPSDNFLIVDGSLFSGGTVVWEQQPTLTGHLNYTFCAYLKNIVRPGLNLAKPLVILEIVDGAGNILAKSLATTLVEGQAWKKISVNWTPLPIAYTFPIKIRIRSLSDKKIGNDFAVDCISFSGCTFGPTFCSCPNSSSGNNLIANGDFSAGYAGFNSSLTWDYGLTQNCSPGIFGVHPDLPSFCSGWPTSSAASPPYCLVIDGSNSNSNPQVLWASIVNLSPNTNYCFSFKWTPAYNSSDQAIPIDIRLIDGFGNSIPVNPILSSGILTGNMNNWYTNNFSWTPNITLAGNYYLAIRQLSSGAYRDFAIDDICLTKIPPCSVSVTAVQQNSCGEFNWIATASGPGPYSYQWSCPGTTNDNILSTVQPCGTSTCTVTATCADGNTATAQSTITTADNVPPAITCPGNQVIQGEYNARKRCVSEVTGLKAIYSDNCPSLNVQHKFDFGTYVPGDDVSGAIFMGTTQVTYLATDWCGNTNSCSFTITITCDTCQCNKLDMAELIVNGDFNAVGTIPGSDYTNDCTQNAEAEYCISSLPAAVNPGFINCGDHTTGSGNMMVVNGGLNPSLQVWYQKNIPVAPNTDYQFCFWYTSLGRVSPAQLKVLIDGIPVPVTLQAPSAPCVWKKYCYCFKSTNRSVDIAIKDLNLLGPGNDFALDDISLKECKKDSCICPPDNHPMSLSVNGATITIQGSSSGANVSALPCPINDVSLSGFVGCFANNRMDPCDEETKVVYTLSGPTGTVSMGSTNNYPVFLFPASSFVANAVYTLTLKTLCPGAKDSCVLKYRWIFKCDTCCSDRKKFISNIQSLVSLMVDPKLCKATLNIGNLPPCDQIRNINWGEAPSSAGPFGANTMPMHTYSGSGTYYVSYLAEEWDYSGPTPRLCLEYLVRDTIVLKCDTCACKSFQDLSFVNSNWPNPVRQVSCGSRIVPLPCTPSGQTMLFHGNMLCTKDGCISNPNVFYQIKPLNGGPAILTASVPVNLISGHFDIPLTSNLFSPGVNYTILIGGYCGLDFCTCNVNFVFGACPCNCDTLHQNVSPGFSLRGNRFFCKRTFKPIALCDNDIVKWYVTFPNSGVQAIGQTTGNNTISYTFPANGTYKICMVVDRIYNGQLCRDSSCRIIKVQCNRPYSLDLCENGLVVNSDFSEIYAEGHLENPGRLKAWSLLPNFGHGLVIAEIEGYEDDGSLTLIGNKHNKAGIYQAIDLSNVDSVVIGFNLTNYSDNSLLTDAEVEISFQKEPIPDDPNKMVLIRKMAPAFDVKDKLNLATVPGFRYIVINLDNQSDDSWTAVGIDNVEVCVLRKTVKTNDEKFQRLGIFPNPSKDQIFVEFDFPAKAGLQFKLTDVRGAVLQVTDAAAGKSIQKIDINHLLPGMYILSAYQNGKLMGAEKFVKE